MEFEANETASYNTAENGIDLGHGGLVINNLKNQSN